MAYVENIQTVYSDKRRAICKYVLDGTGLRTGVKATIVDVSALGWGTDLCKIIKTKAEFDTNAAVGGLWNLYWDSGTDMFIMGGLMTKTTRLPNSLDLDFTSFGGLRNDAGGSPTGDIVIETTSITTTLSLFMILEVKRC